MAVPQRDFVEVVAEPVQLGRYVLLDAVAQGRTGTVYRACQREQQAGKLLAVKRIKPELSGDAWFAERFVEAMRHAAQLEHPSHCAIEDVGQAPDGSLYVAMELLAGKDLGRVAIEIEERGLNMPPALVAYVGLQVAEALAAAHQMTRSGDPAPLYHGEITPSDILIGYDGRVLLTGLGSAEVPSATPRSSYRAPELAQGAPCSARSDVFSLGACLYELLTGAPALIDEASGRAPGAPRKPESHVTQVVSRPLEQVVSRALSQQPEQRWQSADEMAQALRAWSAAQETTSDRRSLAVLMIALFDGQMADEERRLPALLARVPREETGISIPVSAQAQLTEPRHSYARLVRAGGRHTPSARPAPAAVSARPAASAQAPASAQPSPSAQLSPSAQAPASAQPSSSIPVDWLDPDENTPPRAMLMRKLAGDMVGAKPPPPQRREAERPATGKQPSRPHDVPPLKLQDLADAPWDDESPTIGWISRSDEQLRSARPQVPPLHSMPIPSLPKPPPLPTRITAQVPPLPPLSGRVAPQVPVSGSPLSGRVAGQAPAPAPLRSNRVAPQAPASVPPLPAAGPASLPPARRPRWLVPVAASAALGLAAAAALVWSARSGGDQRSTLEVRTRPAGAEVFVRGARLGVTPLRIADAEPGAVAIELRAAGFERATRAVALEPGKVVYLDVDLLRSSAADAAATRDQAAPAQAGLPTSAQDEEASAFDDEPGHDRAPRKRRRVGGLREAAAADAEPSAAEPDEPAASTAAKLAAEPKPGAVAAMPAPVQPAVAPARPLATTAAAAPAQPAPSASHGISRAAVAIEQEPPRFPARAKRMGIAEGAVTIEFTIDASGAVKNAKVVKSDPQGLFEENALRAIANWRYNPKLDNGTPVATRQRFTIRFRE